MNYINEDAREYTRVLQLKRFLEGHNGYIAGGCFKNIFNGENYKDIDIFFRNNPDYEQALIVYQNNKDFIPAYQTEKVTAFREKNTGITVELIFSFLMNPKNMLDTFDFTITKACLLSNDDCRKEERDFEFIYHPKFFEHLFLKRIVIDSDILAMPLSTFNRSFKYIKYGYSLCRESKLKIVNDILNLSKENNIDKFTLDDIDKTLYDGID